MAFRLALLCGFLFLQGTWSSPAEFSFGVGGGNGGVLGLKANVGGGANTNGGVNIGEGTRTTLSGDISTATGKIGGGISSIVNPIRKFGLTIPSVIGDGAKSAGSAIKTMIDTTGEGVGLVGNGLKHVLGGTLIAGSSVLGGGLGVAGTLLDKGFDVITGGLETGISLGSEAANAVAIGNALMFDLTRSALLGFGDGLSTAGTGVDHIVGGTKNLIDAFGKGIKYSMDRAETTLANLMKRGVTIGEDGVMKFSNNIQKHYYNALQNYIQTLLQLETLMNKMSVNVGGVMNSATDMAADAAEEAGANLEAGLEVGAGLLGDLAVKAAKGIQDISPKVDVSVDASFGSKST